MSGGFRMKQPGKSRDSAMSCPPGYSGHDPAASQASSDPAGQDPQGRSTNQLPGLSGVSTGKRDRNKVAKG